MPVTLSGDEALEIVKELLESGRWTVEVSEDGSRLSLRVA